MSSARAKCQRTRFTQEVLRQERDQGVSRKSQMSGWSGLCNLVRLRDVFHLRWNSLSLKAPASARSTCARTSVAGCVGPQLGFSACHFPPAHRQPRRAVGSSGASECVYVAHTHVRYGKNRCCLVLPHKHWRQGAHERHAGTGAPSSSVVLILRVLMVSIGSSNRSVKLASEGELAC